MIKDLLNDFLDYIIQYYACRFQISYVFCHFVIEYLVLLCAANIISYRKMPLLGLIAILLVHLETHRLPFTDSNIFAAQCICYAEIFAYLDMELKK